MFRQQQGNKNILCSRNKYNVTISDPVRFVNVFFPPLLYKSVEFCVTTPPVGQSYYVQKHFCIFVFITRVDNIKKKNLFKHTLFKQAK